jgi:hypothetical protein
VAEHPIRAALERLIKISSKLGPGSSAERDVVVEQRACEGQR